MNIWYLSFWVWLILLNTMSSSWIHLPQLSIFKDQQYSIVYLHHIFCVSVNYYAWLGRFQMVLIMKSPALNMLLQIFVWFHMFKMLFCILNYFINIKCSSSHISQCSYEDSGISHPIIPLAYKLVHNFHFKNGIPSVHFSITCATFY